MKRILVALIFLMSLSAHAQISLWPTIPFMRGADLCQFQEAYGQTRQQTMREAADVAYDFLLSGHYGNAVQLLYRLNDLVTRNRQLATQGNGLDVTLESTLHGYVDRLYVQYKPREKKIQFSHARPLMDVIARQERQVDEALLNRLTGFAYGTYSYAPGCAGDLLVTLTVVSKGGRTETFMAQNKPQLVMGDIASRMFEAYQRTTFPTTLRIRTRTLKLLGGLNNSVDRARTTEQAEVACATLDGRLPTKDEYEAISLYGDWSGGVSLNNGTWALAGGFVYHAPFRTHPVRQPWEVNAEEYLYYCVQ